MAQFAQNPETGAWVVNLGEGWTPAEVADNPDTGERAYRVGDGGWTVLPGAAAPIGDQSTAGGDLSAGIGMLQQLVPGLEASQQMLRINRSLDPNRIPDLERQFGDLHPALRERLATETDDAVSKLVPPAMEIARLQGEIDQNPVNPTAQSVMEADGFMGALGAAARGLGEDPYGMMRTFVLRSLPAAAPSIGATIGGQLVAGPAGAAAGAGAAEFATEAGISTSQGLVEAMGQQGLDTSNPEAIEAWTRENPDLMREIVVDALQRAGIISATGAVGGAASGALTRRAAQTGRAGTKRAADIGAALVVDPATEGAGEALAGGSGADVVAEMLGGLGQGAVTTTGQLAIEAARAPREVINEGGNAIVEQPGGPDRQAPPAPVPGSDDGPQSGGSPLQAEEGVTRPRVTPLGDGRTRIEIDDLVIETDNPQRVLERMGVAPNEAVSGGNQPDPQAGLSQTEAPKPEKIAAPKLSAAPTVRHLQTLGGVDPAGPAGQELRAQGVTPQRFPNLFRKGGLQDVDNLVAAEADADLREVIAGVPEGQPGGGYFERQDVLDAIVEEAARAPRRSQAQTAAIEASEALAAEFDFDVPPAQDAERMANEAGIPYIQPPENDTIDGDERFAQIVDTVERFAAEENMVLQPAEVETIAETLDANGGDVDRAISWWLLNEVSYVESDTPESWTEAPFPDAPRGERPAGGGDAEAGAVAGAAGEGPARAGSAEPAPGQVAVERDAEPGPAGGAPVTEINADREDESVGAGPETVSEYREIDIEATRARMAEATGEAAKDVKARLQRSGKLTNTFRRQSNLGGGVFNTYDARARDIAAKAESPALDRLVEALKTQAGGTVTRTGGTLEERYNAATQRHINQVGKILSALSKKADRAAIIKALRTGDMTRLSSGERTAVKGVRKFLKDQLAYMRKAGVDVGEVKDNYFVREYDADKVIRNREAFVVAAEALYQQNFEDNPRQKAEEFADAITMGEKVDLTGVKRTGEAAPFASREFGPDADQLLGEFMVEDLEATLLAYVNRVARRAEIAREFGDQFSEFDAKYGDEMRQDGVPAELVRFMEDYIMDQLGIPPNPKQPRNVMAGALHAAGIMGLLEHAVITSLPEIVTPALRAGSMLDLPITAVQAVRDLLIKAIPGLPKAKQLQAYEELAMDLGVIVQNSYQSMQLARFSENENFSRGQAKALAGFFRASGLEQFTQWTRIQAVRTGFYFLRRAARAAKGQSLIVSKDWANDMLAELGVQPGQRDAVVDHLLRIEGRPRPADLEGETGVAIREALFRFVDQSIMRPNAATKPKWAQRGRGLGDFGPMVFALQSFGYAYAKNVLGRGIRNTGKAGGALARGRLGDAVMYAGPALMTILLIPALQYALGEARDDLDEEVTGKERNLTDNAKLERALSRAGLFGAADPYIQMFAGTRYNRSSAQAISGPVIGAMSDVFDSVAQTQTRDSARTNTQERRAAGAVYAGAIEPALNAAIGLAMPNILGTLALQATRYGKDPFVDATMGPASSERGATEIQGLLDLL